ncbi:Uncharacterised protein [Enterococcus durans]|uniref:ABC transmembrane type-1 domain-containing protein n=1 Tax=Enterococcus durans TaxID=53345 RepID=A0A377KL59_9ENTE|nr:ABC transporter ATP-binding protein [Enterococcus durans]STP29826.1 Uncharacterised protein [Enterococcus durans]
MKKIMLLFWKQNLVIFWIMLGLAFSISFISFSSVAVVNAIVAFSPSLFWKAIAKTTLFYGLFLLFTYLRIRKVSSTIQLMSTHIRGEATKKMINSGFQNFKLRSTGTYASWLSNDVSQIEQLGFKMFYDLVSGIITSVIALVSLLFFIGRWPSYPWSKSFFYCRFRKYLRNKLPKRPRKLPAKMSFF